VLEDLYITIPRGTYDSLEMIQKMPATIEAPVAQGQPLAEIRVSLDGVVIATESLRALDDNPQGSLWQRARDGVSLWFE
jgi:D-alanyl-D-alanine carboxypeptidase (penicillin-binding protein 5/6)